MNKKYKLTHVFYFYTTEAFFKRTCKWLFWQFKPFSIQERIITASLKSRYNDESLPSSIKILKPVYNQISFSCMCFMGTIKKTEYDLICKAFIEVFFNCQNSTFHSSNSFFSKEESNLVTIVVSSLTAWVGVITIS